MQFIEKSTFAVRSAVYELKHPDSRVRFVLFPMVHVADPAFYTAVAERIAICSTVILEGVQSARAGHLALSYSILGKLGKLGLTLQDDDSLLSSFSGSIIDGDLPGKEFDEGWVQLPLHLRILVGFFAPVVGVLQLFKMSRKALAPRSVDDLPSRKSVLQHANADSLDGVILDERDVHLSKVAGDFFAENRHAQERVGVVFGAKHMPHLMRYLCHSLGFKVLSAEWITVMSLPDA